MSESYQRIVVGTDGSESSLLAVERAARMSAAFGAELIICCAYFDSPEEAERNPRSDSRTILGTDPARENLEAAAAHAHEVGARKISTTVYPGTPVQALVAVAQDYAADLLVVGNRGINSLTGRLVGSVPADVARQSRCDVLIAHTAQ